MHFGVQIQTQLKSTGIEHSNNKCFAYQVMSAGDYAIIGTGMEVVGGFDCQSVILSHPRQGHHSQEFGLSRLGPCHQTLPVQIGI